MNDDYNTYSRVNRYDKRRKNTKAISWLIALGSVLVILLIGIFIFGDKDDTSAVDESNENTTANEDNETDNGQDIEDENNPSPSEDQEGAQDGVTDQDDSQSEDQDGQPASEPVNVEVEEVESDDDNVIRAFEGNWGPIGTSVEEPFQIPWNNWEEESQSWQELLEAISIATDLSEDNFITWWVTNNGPQKVKATVTNRAETENYRVYVSWIENEGWAPTRVEILKENDEKYRFEDDDDNSEEGTETQQTTNDQNENNTTSEMTE